MAKNLSTLHPFTQWLCDINMLSKYLGKHSSVCGHLIVQWFSYTFEKGKHFVTMSFYISSVEMSVFRYSKLLHLITAGTP